MRRRKCLVWRTPSPPYAYGRLAGAAMGLLEWWRRNREQADANRRSVALNDDQVLIAQQVPELAGMSDVQGMAYVLEQIEDRSEEHTSELQSLMRISYAVFCLKKKKTTTITHV